MHAVCVRDAQSIRNIARQIQSLKAVLGKKRKFRPLEGCRSFHFGKRLGARREICACPVCACPVCACPVCACPVCACCLCFLTQFLWHRAAPKLSQCTGNGVRKAVRNKKPANIQFTHRSLYAKASACFFRSLTERVRQTLCGKTVKDRADELHQRRFTRFVWTIEKIDAGFQILEPQTVPFTKFFNVKCANDHRLRSSCA